MIKYPDWLKKSKEEAQKDIDKAQKSLELITCGIKAKIATADKLTSQELYDCFSALLSAEIRLDIARSEYTDEDEETTGEVVNV